MRPKAGLDQGEHPVDEDRRGRFEPRAAAGAEDSADERGGGDHGGGGDAHERPEREAPAGGEDREARVSIPDDCNFWIEK